MDNNEDLKVSTEIERNTRKKIRSNTIGVKNTEQNVKKKPLDQKFNDSIIYKETQYSHDQNLQVYGTGANSPTFEVMDENFILDQYQKSYFSNTNDKDVNILSK